MNNERLASVWDAIENTPAEAENMKALLRFVWARGQVPLVYPGPRSGLTAEMEAWLDAGRRRTPCGQSVDVARDRGDKLGTTRLIFLVLARSVRRVAPSLLHSSTLCPHCAAQPPLRAQDACGATTTGFVTVGTVTGWCPTHTKRNRGNMKLRSALMMALKEHIARTGLSQSEAAKLFGVTQPRVSDLVRGKINLFGLDALVNMASRLACTWKCACWTPHRAGAFRILTGPAVPKLVGDAQMPGGADWHDNRPYRACPTALGSAQPVEGRRMQRW